VGGWLAGSLAAAAALGLRAPCDGVTVSRTRGRCACSALCCCKQVHTGGACTFLFRSTEKGEGIYRKCCNSVVLPGALLPGQRPVTLRHAHTSTGSSGGGPACRRTQTASTLHYPLRHEHESRSVTLPSFSSARCEKICHYYDPTRICKAGRGCRARSTAPLIAPKRSEHLCCLSDRTARWRRCRAVSAKAAHETGKKGTGQQWEHGGKATTSFLFGL
jgi:hypothetical protein